MSEKIRNTFAPHLDLQELTAFQVVQLLNLHIIEYDDLPTTVRPIIDREIKKIAK